MKIPAGSQTGKVLRLRGEGIPVLNSPNRRGDMYIKIVVQVPTRLSSRAKDLLKDFAVENGEDDNPKPIPLAEL